MLILKSVNFEQREFQTHQLEALQPGQTEWVVGRHTTCDLVLMSPEVSRVHGRISYLDDAYHFTDVGSASGSLLNGENLLVDKPYQIHPGDLLQLGQTFLHIEELVIPLPTGMSSANAVTAIVMPTQPWAGEDLLCRCCRIIDETPDVKTFCFVADPPVLFSYKPGQFVTLEVVIDDKPVLRSYSISSSPTRPYHLSVTVKRVPSSAPDLPPGVVSNWLHDHLTVGDRVKLIGGAIGQFTCLPNLPSKMLLISAGSGITPMMSMLRWVQDTLTDCDIVFLHSAASPDDIVFRAELEAIAAQMPNLRLAITITQPSPNHAWMGLTGRISPSMLPLIAPDFLDRSVYVCGSERFMQAMRSGLESLKFPMQNYQEESFGGKLAPVQPASLESRPDSIAIQSIPVESFVTSNGKRWPSDHLPATQTVLQDTASVIHFTNSDRQVLIDGSTVILNIAEEEGIQIRHACRVGACGMCKVRVRKGQVRYQSPPAALTQADQQAGYALACVAYPVGSLEIEA